MNQHMGFKIVKASKEMNFTKCDKCNGKVRYFVVFGDSKYCQSCYDKDYRSMNGFGVKDYNFTDLITLQEGMKELANFAKQNNLGYYRTSEQFYYLLEMMGGKQIRGVQFVPNGAGCVVVKVGFNRTLNIHINSEERARVLYRLFLYYIRGV